MRVLAVGNAYPPHHLGGYEVIWRGVMRRLRDEGHRGRVLTTAHRTRAAGGDEDPDVHRELDWYWRDHAWRVLGPLARLRLEQRNAAVLDRHLTDFRPDVVAWWPLGGMSLGLVERVRRAGIPAVFFVLDFWPAYGRRHDLWMRSWRRLEPLAGAAERLTGLPARVDWRGAGRWVFCSRTVLDSTRAELGVAGGSILAPGVDRAFQEAAASEAPPWRWRLLYTGRVVEQKGVLTAVEALALLPAGAVLRVVGDGDGGYRAELERRAAQLGVGDRIRFEPARAHERMPEVYRSCDALLFPVAWAEPWGLVPLEAMALGRPVVATGTGGSGDYLAGGENALLFEPGDAIGLAAAVQMLAGDAALRRRLIAGGRRTAAAHGEDAFNAAAVAELESAASMRSRRV